MNKNAELVEFIWSLSAEQIDKVVAHLDILKRLVDMTENEMIFTETFLDRLFGEV
ncbi:hypothetical protein AABM06_03480 [Listeria ivanovii]|uniref:hypothetical protein n=1 Tax=Listeria ivanovii TaxID=1638 RepID=UPI0016279FBC|nr:hypothetical protein [Listeria ivanovii]MBC1758733.1 hypothetical protein [Listeria ivanovii]